MREKLNARTLIRKLQTGELSDAERDMLESWYLTWINNDATELSDDQIHNALEHIDNNIPHLLYKPKVRLWPKYIPAAAVILLCLSVSAYFLLHKQQPRQQVAIQLVHDIPPGTNGAILTLSNGQKIVLGNTKKGMVAQQNGSAIQKAGDSLLVYQKAGNNNAVISYNTITTPRGRQFAVQLPDGSKVWLNAASSLKYPTTFNGSERLVELTGEAYFEIAHKKNQPFRIKTPTQLIEDIGTHFNVTAYDDEPRQLTTLVEGSIRVNGLLLQPGQQSDGRSVQTVDTTTAVAWKNGYFRFDHAGLPVAMRQLARWYNVDVVYEGELPKMTINGKMPRNMSAAHVFEVLSYLRVNFRIDGRKFIVSNK